MLAEELGLPADFIISYAPQGSDEWHEARRGVCTGSKAKDARDRLADKPAKEAKFHKKTSELLAEAQEAVRGGPSLKQDLYARDLARAREHGCVRGVFQTADMREGQEEEPKARQAYELATGRLVEEIGFICTGDRKFGVSPDGLLFDVVDGKQDRGAIEIKTMLSSATLFTALVFGDYSEYLDQILMEMWLLHLDWVDLVLWAPDLPEGRQMRVIRVLRDQNAIDELVDDLTQFDASVERYRQQLRAWIDGEAEQAPPAEAAPIEPQPVQKASVALDAIPESIF